ncbi:unnamed protein product [Pedinophyceae sp. YPF-701]|nr:unnamed protein product [Pedinophyceae sp. YPF-701]
MSDEDMDYGFEYSDDEEQEEDVDIENQYYNSKGNLEDGDRDTALEGFRKVVEMEGDEKGEWGFKALKQAVKLQCLSKDYQGMTESYKEMLTYIHSAVTRNHGEKKINSVLDFVAQTVGDGPDASLLEDMYEATLAAMEGARNERLWFKVSTRLAALWLRRGDLARLGALLKGLRKWCLQDGEEDPRKGTQLLEVLALEIQMRTEQKDHQRLRDLYRRALGVKSAIPHPRILGVVKECGGKMLMRERRWEDACTDFFEAFKAYDEAGSPRRTLCLKYLLLASMLNQSAVDPFDSQEARPYRSDPDVVAMAHLVDAYRSNRMADFEAALAAGREQVMGDPFIAQHVEDLLHALRKQVLQVMLRPYRRVSVEWAARQLKVSTDDVESLLVSLILDGKLDGRIDQTTGTLEVRGQGQAAVAAATTAAAKVAATSQAPKAGAAATAPAAEEAEGEDTGRYAALSAWWTQLGKLHATVSAKLS